MANRRSVTAAAQKETGLKSDSDAWGSGVLFFGGLASKAFTYLEHLEFLASAREGGFKMIIDLWNTYGWWIASAVGVVWFLDRLGKRNEPRPKGLTRGFVIASVLISAIFSSLLTVQFVGTIPATLTSMNYTVSTVPAGLFVSGCSGQINSSILMSFKRDFKVALVCVQKDPNVDQLNDKRILVSPLFEIIDGIIPVAAPNSPNGNFVVRTPSISIDYLPILVPQQVAWGKITTLEDLLQLGGKILDPRYY